ncbi:MAG: hypothetical protein EXQ47_03465 [Bryobacterales bacterium]|nr:hypothetical protein [Bryobacterales bacterium]
MRVLVIAGLLAALVATTGATTLQQLSLGEMARQSTAIVRGRVFQSRTMLRNGAVYTLYRIETLETLKSDPSRPAASEVAVPGGIAGGIRQPVVGAPTLRGGSEYILFLWTGRSGLTQITGLSQGLFSIQSGTARREAASERMLDAAGRPVRDTARVMPVTQLKAQITQAVRNGPEVAGIGKGRK